MRKEEQRQINIIAQTHFQLAVAQLPVAAFSYLNKRQLREAGAKQLKSCQAWVWETKDYYVLQSYNTFVACIEKSTDTLYDVLRTEYGYTATSAKHISIFRKCAPYGGYGNGKWGCENCYTAR